jgi:predicted S18 family serine protease
MEAALADQLDARQADVVKATPEQAREGMEKLLREKFGDAKLLAELAAAKARISELEGALAKAWSMFEDAGVMREPDGRTGNEALDNLGSHLDEWAMRSAATTLDTPDTEGGENA